MPASSVDRPERTFLRRISAAIFACVVAFGPAAFVHAPLLRGELPLFREDKRWRVTGIANEELPLTFSLYQRNDVTVITHTMAESLGLEVPKKSRKDQQLVDGPRVRATPVKLASLRFGQHVLRDVEVFVLAPEHENLGARISHSAFRGLRVRVVPERLLLLLEPGEARDAS